MPLTIIIVLPFQGKSVSYSSIHQETYQDPCNDYDIHYVATSMNDAKYHCDHIEQCAAIQHDVESGQYNLIGRCLNPAINDLFQRDLPFDSDPDSDFDDSLDRLYDNDLLTTVAMQVAESTIRYVCFCEVQVY